MNAKMELLGRIYDIGAREDTIYFIGLDSDFYQYGDIFNIQYLKEKEYIIVDAETDHLEPTLVSITVEGVDLVEKSRGIWSGL